jgi:hypothetical protein
MRRRRDELVVFLGPSLPAAAARAMAPCMVLPPARQGDLWRALSLNPKAIALVDGVFEAVPSVWHHEILAALDAGVAVFGGASMGALRASELWRQGMVGVGRIFGWYRDGVLTDDSEVALLHAGPEHGCAPFTVPLVNVRHNAALAVAKRVLTRSEARELVDAARAIFFQDRTWERIAAALASRWSTATQRRWARFASIGLEDLKALDARACIGAAADFVQSGGRLATSQDARQPSSLVRRRRLLESVTEGVENRRILEALRGREDSGELVAAGLRTLLLAAWAREQGILATRQEREGAQASWWRQQRIPAARRAAHLRRLGLDGAEAARLWEALALEVKVLAHAERLVNDGPSAVEALAFESRRRGLFRASCSRRRSAPSKR